MPDPRPLGHVAKTVVNSVRDFEETDISDALAITAAVGKGNMEEVLYLAERIAHRNLGTFRALTYLSADLPGQSEEAIMDTKAREKTAGANK